MRCLLLILLLNGCSSSGTLKGSGEPVLAPLGYIKLCAEHPEFEACK